MESPTNLSDELPRLVEMRSAKGIAGVEHVSAVGNVHGSE
jgi:hypothetical protein